MKKNPKIRKGAWFVKIRGSYLPASWQGWLTYIPYISLLLLPVYVDLAHGFSHRSCRVNDFIDVTFVGSHLVYYVVVVGLMSLFAKEKS